jgi:hypothetical protein
LRQKAAREKTLLEKQEELKEARGASCAGGGGVNLRERAEADLALTMEDSDGAGTACTLIGPGGNEYAVTGVAGDTSLLYSAAVPGYTDAELIRNRTIRCSCRIGTLAAQTEAVPARGWRRVKTRRVKTRRVKTRGVKTRRSMMSVSLSKTAALTRLGAGNRPCVL